MFPSFATDGRLNPKDRVFALRFFGGAAAYPLEVLAAEMVVNDVVGPQEVVIVTDPESKGTRAFDRGGHVFTPGSSAREVVDERGAMWQVTEDALIRSTGGAERLARLPGHDAFWFGWYAFHPHTELYEGKQ